MPLFNRWAVLIRETTLSYKERTFKCIVKYIAITIWLYPNSLSEVQIYISTWHCRERRNMIEIKENMHCGGEIKVEQIIYTLAQPIIMITSMLWRIKQMKAICYAGLTNYNPIPRELL